MILKTMDKATFVLSESETRGVLDAIKRSDKYITIQGAFILTSSVSGIYPEEALEKHETGRLHDGTKVIKKFGAWVDARNPDVRLDAAYYPEIARDEVLTELEWKRAGLDQLDGEHRQYCYQLTIEKRLEDEAATNTIKKLT